MLLKGDVLSGTTEDGIHHTGVLEGWFGAQWWNGRLCILLVTTLGIFTPLACLKRIGKLHFQSSCELVPAKCLYFDKSRDYILVD